MLRFLFRLAAMVALSVAVIMAVLDATRSVAASALVMTPLNSSWLAVSPDTRAAFETFVRAKASPIVWDAGIAWVLAQPGFAVFAVAALLFHAIGYRRRRRGGEFAPG
jgi:predicted xylose isomerase-like sugar epimerase